LATLDVVHVVERNPGADEKIAATQQFFAAGGPAANAAVTFAALGGAASVVTAVGRHPLGRVIAADLAANDVRLIDAGPDDETPPAVSAIRVDERTGARNVTSVNAAGSQIEWLADANAEVARAGIVLLDGHHPQLQRRAAVAAHDAGVPVLLDAGSWKPVIEDVLPHVDYAICSATFRVPGGRRSDRYLLDRGVGAVAITSGGRPIRWSTDADAGELEVPVVPVRDTTGAGDAMHGAAAFLLARGDRDWAHVVRVAAEVATVRVQHMGPRGWLSDARLRAMVAAG
jgi:sugar/nucleoside kinase (ribokinase family)